MTSNSDYFQNYHSFRFLRFPHSLLFDVKYAKVSNDAKILFALMYDRISLSEKNGFYDKQGRVFIYYTIKEIESTLHCSHNKAIRMLNELEGIKLIQRAKQGQGRPTKFYIKRVF